MKSSEYSGERMLDAIGFIGEDIIAEAGASLPTVATIPSKRRRQFKMNVKIVAALLAILMMGAIWPAAQYIYDQYYAAQVTTPPDETTEEHDWATVKTLREPTCTVPGEKLVKCQICQGEEIREIPALGHTPDEWVIDYEASIGKDGQKHATCTICGEYYTEIIYATGSPGLEYKLVCYGVDGKHCEEYECYIGTCEEENIIVAKGYNDLPVTRVAISMKTEDTRIKSIYVPSTVIAFSDSFGRNLKGLTSISFEEDHPLFYYADDRVINKETKELVILFNGAEIPTDGSVTALTGTTFNLTDKNAETFVIPECITKIGSSTFMHFRNLKSIELHDGITEIGMNAFVGCESLTEISIPDSVKGFGSGVFWGCTKLEKVKYSANVTGVPRDTFYDCSSLKSVEGLDSVRFIGGNAFGNCSSLAEIKLPDTLESIDSGAFERCTSLTEIVIPDSVTEIYSATFGGCTSLKSVSFGKSTALLDRWAFSDCTSLTTVNITDSISYIHPTVFVGCSNLTEISISARNKFFTMSQGCLINIEDRALVMALDDFTIPTDGSIAIIDEYAFYERADITEIVIPEGVRKIGMDAFCGCKNLRSVTLPDSLESIDTSAFKESGLESISFGSGLWEIGTCAFSGCKSLTTLILPQEVHTINREAFELCDKLTELYLPASIRVLDNDFVKKCTSLKVVDYGGTAEEWESIKKGRLNITNWSCGIEGLTVRCTDATITLKK